MNVSVVINVHREGLLSVATIRSVELAVAQAARHGIRVEIVPVLDRASFSTQNVVRKLLPTSQPVVTNFGDLGLARNAGAQRAVGEWVCFVDGDDIWGPDWIRLAYTAATEDERPIIWHPQYSVYFEGNEHIYEHVDMEESDFDVRFLLSSNYWTSAAFATRKTLLDFPYQPANRADLQGYEDWNWHCRTIEGGYLHKVARDTVHFIRRRPASMSRSMLASNAMCIPHTLFRSLRKRAITT